MKVTKHEHAHMVVDDTLIKLIIDPGVFSTQVAEPDVSAVVITHGHEDHWTPEHLTAIRDVNPGVPIYGPSDFAEAAAEFDVIAVAPGDQIEIGGAILKFTGGEHEPIHENIRVGSNVGVIVNDRFYFPGDSYTRPGRDIELLAVPIGGPWFSLAGAVDLITDVQAPEMINTHDSVLSAAGQAMHSDILRSVAGAWGGTFTQLDAGDAREF